MILVKPRLRLEPTIQLSLMLGAGTVLVMSLFLLNPLVQSGYISPSGILRVLLIGIFLPVALYAAIFSCVSQRRLLTFASSYAFCFAAVFVGTIRYIGTAGGSSVVSPLLILVCILSLFVALVGGALGLVVNVIVKTIAVTVLEQNGTLCPTCGYKLVPQDVPRCPECGKNPHRTPTWWSGFPSATFVYKRSRLITIIAVMAAAGMVVRDILVMVGPMQQFHDRFKGPEESFALVSMLSEDYHQDDVIWREQGHIQTLSDDPTRALLIIYAPGARWSQPTMQIRLTWTTVTPPGFPTSFFDGLPEIMANLDRRQAELVIEHGVPQTLIDALLEATSTAGWPAVRPAPGPGGAITLSKTWNGPAKCVVVPAESHFPAKMADEDTDPPD